MFIKNELEKLESSLLGSAGEVVYKVGRSKIYSDLGSGSGSDSETGSGSDSDIGSGSP